MGSSLYHSPSYCPETELSLKPATSSQLPAAKLWICSSPSTMQEMQVCMAMPDSVGSRALNSGLHGFTVSAHSLNHTPANPYFKGGGVGKHHFVLHS